MIKYSIKIFTLRFMYTLFYLHFKLQVKHIDKILVQCYVVDVILVF